MFLLSAYHDPTRRALILCSIEISFAVEDEDDQDDEEGESDESSEEDDTEDAALQAESDLQGENGEIDGAQKTDPFAGVPGIYITAEVKVTIVDKMVRSQPQPIPYTPANSRL